MSIKSYLYRSIVLANILAIVTLGYIVRFSPSLPEYIRDPAGGIAYQMLWMLVVVLSIPVPIDG